MILLAALVALGVPAPPVAELCPQGFQWDSMNCFLGKAPPGTRPFIYKGAFYYSPLPGPTKCQPPATFDSANCFVRNVPSAYPPFIWNGGFYVGQNQHLGFHSPACAEGFQFDGSNCLLGHAPEGRRANIFLRHFTYSRKPWEQCWKIRSGSHGIDPIHCSVGKVPHGYDAYTHENRWYTKPKGAGAGQWFAKPYISTPEKEARPLCRGDDPHRKWKLAWADEFDARPEGTRCYNTDDHLQCVYTPYWGFRRCDDSPPGWDAKSRAKWTRPQHAKFGGLVQLDKCRWTVLDSFNTWDASNAPGERTNSFRPENVRIEGGVMKMVTASHPPAGGKYDCGREIPEQHAWTSNCPHSGATLWSLTGLPWTQGNDPANPDPAKRYVGRAISYGRIEFRANVARIGHGAWPSLWLFVDQRLDPAQGIGELDALELLADLGGDPDQIVRRTATYGMGWQTIHNWGVDAAGYPHTSEGVGVPIRIGEWHVYAIEYEADEVRVYVDGCLRNRIREGQTIQLEGGGTRPFHIPRNQTQHIFLGNPASAASWLPRWYRAWGGGHQDGRADFVPTELHVDYVRAYVATGEHAARRAPSGHKPIRHPGRAQPGHRSR